MNNFWNSKWIPFVTERPLATIALILGLTIAIVLGITGVGLSASPREYMGLHSPRTLELVRLENEYSKNNSVMVMFSVANGDVFNPQALAALRHITENAWYLPHAERVDSITNFQYAHAIGDEVIVDDLVNDTPLDLDQAQLARIRDIALHEPRLASFLISPDGRATAVNITFAVEQHDNAALKQIEREVDVLIAQTKTLYPDFETRETGYIEVCLGWLNALTFDVQFMFSSAFILMCAVLFLFFRSVSITAITMLLALLSVVTSLGLVGYFNAMLHPPSMIGTLVILMLALADSVHLVNRTRTLLAQGYAKKDAVAESLRFNLKPVFITSLTTSIGFLSFIANEFSGIRLMGAYIAFGVMYACLLSISLLPAMMILLRVKPGSAAADASIGADRFSEWIFRLRWWFVAITVPLIVISTYIIAHTTLDDSPIHYIAKTQPFRQDQQVIEDKLTGSIEIVMELNSQQPQGVANPAFMREVAAFSDWLRAQPGVRFVNTYTDTLKQLNQVMHGDAPDNYRLPSSQQLASQYLLLYEMSLPAGLSLTNQLNADKSATRLSFMINDTTTLYMLALSKNIEDWLTANAPHIAAKPPSGDTIEFSISNFHSLNSMFYGALSALAIIGIILLITFRKIMPGTLCTIMVIGPLSVCFGVWSLVVGYFDVGAVLTMCMVIGVVVDNAVHFVSKYQLVAVDKNMAPRDAVKYVINNVGKALIINTLVLAASFSILYFSAFTANGEMGILTVMSLLIGLAGTFTLLPSMLVIWGEWQIRRGQRITAIRTSG